MKTIKFLFALLLTGSTLFTGCFVDINDDDSLFGCMDADGPVTTVELDLEEVTGIALAMEARVELTQGPEQTIIVEGKSDIFDELDLDVNNQGVWTIRTVDCVRDVDNLIFYVTVPDLRDVTVSGSGEVYSTNTFVIEDIDLHISGSGEIDLALDADDIDAHISGSGKTKLEGTADELNINISGSGDLRAFDLFTRKVDVRISGSGDAEVRASERLDVRISGSGDVFYKGNPLLEVSISGSGEVIDAN